MTEWAALHQEELRDNWRLAQQQVQTVEGYEPSWRIRQVARADGGRARSKS